jgi:hypothetical protein
VNKQVFCSFAMVSTTRNGRGGNEKNVSLAHYETLNSDMWPEEEGNC